MDGDSVAGTLGCMPMLVRAFDRTIEMHFSHDLLVDPQYRGLGLAKKLVDKIADGAPLLAGGLWMTGPCYALHQKAGWLAVKPFPGQSFIVDAGAAMKRILPSPLAAQLLGPFAQAYLRLFRGAPTAEDLASHEVDKFDHRVDELFERAAPSLGIIAERTHSYLNWKYVDSPHVSYNRFLIGDEESPSAYFVARRHERDDGLIDGLIVDLLADPSAGLAFECAIGKAVKVLSSDGAEVVHFLTTHQPFRDRLKRLGFRTSSRQNTFVVTGHNDLPSRFDIQNPATWYLTLGDSDGDMWAKSESPRPREATT
jgi:hypothetical protein